ncbi:integrating conjugative element protein [Legionella pneumophila serogroup 1]|uniref:integrating conjugative element protein n=1 Tax=Legionella pneumophila TaxID=446 RepID=UPI000770B050|nr:integrating conjugative element protein [Legionella pneumophila]HAT8862506.1 integrating conjugative element protein [Legionella pneumophila subsp. pneumophila]MDI9825847.1 integrating conjugative element protein [Legionella pneumophila]MDW8896975.1 integrating conjugative element protein [Legionella pneumophila]CZH50186.1 integrating conjugative element protein%2C PFL_4695 family [Legionella pneumophila]CZI55565.1 integrating conjugative element protein%2C PFL_4695 family [Legionella pneum
MRKSAMLFGLLMITSCYAWQAINMDQYIKESQVQLTEESLKLQEKLDARLPVSSKATAGKVERRKLTLINFSNPIFIIGDDANSRQWLQKNTRKLEQAQAIGFVANINSSEQLQELQQLIKTPLLPANVDDLMEIFQENHYPLAFSEGELWQ